MTVTQAQFRTAMLDPDAAVPQGIVNPDGQTASKRFNVYRNNVAVSLTEALEAAFPVVRKLVGDDFFRAMAGVYLRTHPPRSPLMMFYGEAMPQFLRRFPPAKSVPYLPDIALIELRLRQSYHAEDATPIDPQALATLDPDALMRARLTIAPSVWVVSSDYAVHGIYQFNTRADAPTPAKVTEAVLITRPGFDPQLHKIDQTAADAIRALQDGKTLGEALALADDTLELGAVLGLLLGQGAITQIN
ncbi:MAG: DNA-binding domain-containing protein [Pseudomonadota bacterium]